MAEGRTAHPRAVGICLCRCVSLAGAADMEDHAAESDAGRPGSVAAGLCGRVCAQERRADPNRAVRLFTKPTLFGFDDDCVRFCGRRLKLARPGCAGCDVRSDLSADDPVRGTLSAAALCGL